MTATTSLADPCAAGAFRVVIHSLPEPAGCPCPTYSVASLTSTQSYPISTQRLDSLHGPTPAGGANTSLGGLNQRRTSQSESQSYSCREQSLLEVAARVTKSDPFAVCGGPIAHAAAQSVDGGA
eukprot:350190-Chlamydomonas_euryale.AAC.7